MQPYATALIAASSSSAVNTYDKIQQKKDKSIT